MEGRGGKGYRRGGRRKYRGLLLRRGEERSWEGKKREGDGNGRKGRKGRGGKETGPTFSLVHATPLLYQ